MQETYGLVKAGSGYTMEAEVWKQVPGYPEFQVTKDGNIRDLNEPTGARIRQDKKGYIYVLRRNSLPALLVHRAVLMAFDRMPTAGELCRHKNDVSSDNRLENLCWGSTRENVADQKLNAATRLDRFSHHALIDAYTALMKAYKELEARCLRAEAEVFNLKAAVVERYSTTTLNRP